ncbi:PHP domain-containing protein [Halovenus sp. WSH3]|uniref:PHP domain-containing protein n=1 Tax=Halovenus carboxidivorans TaxID=2692199 RepID=A0A6B0TIX9_9EURY|nr:PHP domain-containing protein [Halovenus carboxidivorans]
MLAVELHAHSVSSYDGRDGIEQLLERARQVGLDGLAVTDHDAFAASERAAELAEEYGLVGIPGMEISTAAGHVLALGIDRRIERGLGFRESVERIHDAGGIAVVPHPFQELRKGVLGAIPKRAITAADAIEVYNSRLLTGRSNRQADALAEEYGMAKTAGSDAHTAEMVGRARTLVETEDRTAEGILAAIRDGETAIRGRRTPYRITLKQVAGSATRRARKRLL